MLYGYNEVLIPTIYTLQLVIHEENVIDSSLCNPHLSPAQQLPRFPTTATEHCKQPLLAQSIIHGRHCLSSVSPLQRSIHPRGNPRWMGRTDKFSPFSFFLMEVWPEERLLDSALPLARQQWFPAQRSHTLLLDAVTLEGFPNFPCRY